jgi:Fic family protein
MAQCSEAKGQQTLWESQQPELLEALKEMAMIQSAESSNRIEGVEVEPGRLKPLLMGKLTPRNRPEEEVVGYRRALQLILKNKTFEVRPAFIKKLHLLAQEGGGDAGNWKEKDNAIYEFDQRGNRTLRFQAVTAEKTSEFIGKLCDRYLQELEQDKVPGLLLVGLFVFDFLCIHPFRDGNGRVSRLLTLALLNQLGFTVGKWISLERIVEERKDDYYEALGRSSVGWHDKKHDIIPWLNFFFSITRQAYKEFADRMKNASKDLRGKGELIRQVIQSQDDPFTLKELRSQLPGTSEQMIRKVLTDLKAAKELKLVGRGPGARWRNAKR